MIDPTSPKTTILPMIVAVLALALALAPALSAQKASYTYINQPPPYSNWSPPGLVAVNTPKIGATFQLQVRPSWTGNPFWGPSWSNFLFTGLSNPNFDLGQLRLGSEYCPLGFLFSSGEVVQWLPRAASNYTTLNLQIPNDASLVGLSFWQQVVSIHSSYVTWACDTISASRGGHGVIGT